MSSERETNVQDRFATAEGRAAVAQFSEIVASMAVNAELDGQFMAPIPE